MKKVWFYDFPIGKVGIAEENGCITDLFFERTQAPEEWTREESGLIKRAAGQLREYFAGTRREFDLPLAPAGTGFQLRDWEALRGIPYGETCSYKEIAAAIGNPKACRAVGMANNRNPISIFIPCHRVVGADGKLVGYGGGLDAKRYLLELEQKYK